MPPDDFEGTGSWNEEKRVIATSLRNMTRSIETLTARLEAMNDINRDRINAVEKQISQQVGENTLRIAMLEVKAKTWGAVAGFIAALIVAAVELIAKTIK